VVLKQRYRHKSVNVNYLYKCQIVITYLAGNFYNKQTQLLKNNFVMNDLNANTINVYQEANPILKMQ